MKRHSEQKFSRFNNITAEREKLIRRKLDEDGTRVFWLLETEHGEEKLPKSRAVFLEEKAYEEGLIEIPVTVENEALTLSSRNK